MLAPASAARAVVARDDFPRPVTAASSHGQTRSAGRTVSRELARLLHAHAITRHDFDRRRATYAHAVHVARRLHGTRRAELRGVLDDLDGIAARGLLSASRLAPLFLTLERNRVWWARRPLLADRQRVGFPGSRLVWEHYRGHGIQIQMLASFGKANGLWTGHFNPGLRSLLDELLPLAAHRAGGLVWEGNFGFGGGAAGWASGLVQGTAVQALSRAGRRFHERRYMAAAHAGLAAFRAPPPLGVRQRTRVGARYLIYSFAPGEHVLNAFIQSLNGLFDLGKVAHDRLAARLFAAGDRQARRETPSYDTGAWSLYEPGVESDLNYHELVRDFLAHLCDRTSARVYCVTARRFTAYLHQPPRLVLLTRRVHAGAVSRVRFRLSKISTVRIEIRRGRRLVLSGALTRGRGVGSFAWVPGGAGRYGVRLTARDAAGNLATRRGVIAVSRSRGRR